MKLICISKDDIAGDYQRGIGRRIGSDFQAKYLTIGKVYEGDFGIYPKFPNDLYNLTPDKIIFEIDK